MGKSAQDSTGFRFPEGGGDDIGSYKQPMPNSNAASEDVVELTGNPMASYNISVAGTSKGNYKITDPHGKGEMRGYGAATKGKKISGKMG